MATPFTRLLAAVASLATAYCAVATPCNAWADDMSVAAQVPAQLVQWHSGLTVTGDSYVKAEWKSTLTAIDREDSTAYLAMHGAAGLRDVTEDGFDHSPDPFGARKGALKSVRDPARIQDGSAQRAH